MDLASLDTFIAIAETGSFSAAAARLHLSQPAISKRIAALEMQLNTRLFDRIGREISLTEAGRALLPRARQVLSVLDDTRRALSNLQGDISGRLTLATSHHIGLHRLPPLLRAFTKAHPKVALNIRFLDSEVAYDAVLQGRIELAVITLAPQTNAPLLAQPVWQDALDFVAAQEHPLAHGGAVTLAEVAQHPAVFPGESTFTHQVVHALFEREHLTPQVAMSTNYLETIKMLVSIGIAWSVLPRTLLDNQIVRLPLQGIQLSRQLGYICHTERTLSNAAKAFMELLNQAGAADAANN